MKFVPRFRLEPIPRAGSAARSTVMTGGVSASHAGDVGADTGIPAMTRRPCQFPGFVVAASS